MALRIIEDTDLVDRGVLGQDEVPGYTARRMQEAVEDIVRNIAIPKINEVILYLAEKGATKEDLQNLLIEAGNVTRVFGRAGDVVAQEGDYKYWQVGAAPEKHAEQHKAKGADPINAEDIGAAKTEHSHGNITFDGKIGETNGKILMTGLNGIIEAQPKENCGFAIPPTVANIAGEFTAEDNKTYFGNKITNFIFNCDESKTASCHGWVTFGQRGTVEMNDFDFIDDADDIKNAPNDSRWEFDLEYGCLIVRKRSE
jgi:hypothetical protein